MNFVFNGCFGTSQRCRRQFFLFADKSFQSDVSIHAAEMPLRNKSLHAGLRKRATPFSTRRFLFVAILYCRHVYILTYLPFKYLTINTYV